MSRVRGAAYALLDEVIDLRDPSGAIAGGHLVRPPRADLGPSNL